MKKGKRLRKRLAMLLAIVMIIGFLPGVGSLEVSAAEGNTITGIGGSTSKSEFDEKLKANMDYKVYRNEKLLNDTDNVATGDKLITENGKTFYLIVTGDVNKDGKTNIKDIVKLRKYLVQAEQFDEYQTKAANLAKENKITVKSLVKLRKMLVN